VELGSKDLAAEKLAVLREHFPGIVADGVLDASRLGELVGLEVSAHSDPSEAFGLSWAGKAEAIKTLMRPSSATLRPLVEHSVRFDSAENVFIEGDNLEVLKILQKAYNDQVKVIYIDPPYNTGNDFVYNDDFADPIRRYLEYTGQLDADGNRVAANVEIAGRRHSRWLSMMYPRLMLARNLLSRDGVILVSIDDHEYALLVQIMVEIFGEENFSTSFIWQKKKKPSFLHRNVGSITEYVVCFLRDTEQSAAFSVDTTTAGKKYPLNNAGNSLAVLKFPAGSVRFSRDSCSFEPADMSEGNIVTSLLDRVVVSGGRNVDSFRLEGEWRYSQAKLDEIIAAGEEITISKAPFRPNHVKAGGEVKKMHNLLTPTTYSVETNEDGSAALKDLLGSVPFDNPKPTGLIQTLVKAITYDDLDALVLDFFAGSGTTAHAIALLNASDGGRRRCISVNLPEPTTEDSAAAKAGYAKVTEVTKARLKAILDRVDGADSQGLKTLELARSNFAAAGGEGGNAQALMEQTLVGGDIDPRAVAVEVFLNEGVRLDVHMEWSTIAGVDVVRAGAVIVVPSTTVSQEVVDGVLGMTPSLVVFLEDAFAGKDDVKASAVFACQQANIQMKTV
jgi:adenine-specific DNA-methyltransferase